MSEDTTDNNPVQEWWVYIIRSQGGKLYTGITTDVERRFREHQIDKRKGAKFFRSDPAREVVYRESLANRSCATRRELAIKRLSREAKLKLIARQRGSGRLSLKTRI